jgi:hypothetical protein
MRASDSQLRPIRDHAAEILGARPQVDEWEIAVLHRDHTSEPGACVRGTWVRTQPDRTDRLIDAYRMTILPRIEEFDGFCSASLMVDRASGLAVGSLTFDSKTAMERSREQSQRVRESSMAEAGADIVEVCEFELALAHLRVPEMA